MIAEVATSDTSTTTLIVLSAENEKDKEKLKRLQKYHPALFRLFEVDPRYRVSMAIPK
jgi:hypothetical protein